MQQGLYGNIIIIIMVALIAFAAFFWLQRSRRKARDETPEKDLRYEYVSEPLIGISQDFAEAFDDFLPETEDGIHMMRISFLNRGREPVIPTDFNRPVVVVFPTFCKVEKGRFSEYRGRGSAPEFPPETRPHGNALEISPMTIAAGGVMVFDIAIRGIGKPDGVYGDVAGQGGIPRLGAASADE